MHKNNLMHRDLKTSNLLYKNEGGVLKICDFGLARRFEEPVKQYTNLVCTLWYRSPEILLGCGKYTKSMDMWSAGCIFAEFILQDPLFVGQGELDQIDKIFKILGNPNAKNMPKFTECKMYEGISKVLKKKNNKNRLRDKFPMVPMDEDDNIFLSESGLDLLQKMLAYNPEERISAEQALQHPWFAEEPVPSAEMPLIK